MTKKRLKTLVAPNNPVNGQTITLYSVNNRLISEFDAITKHDSETVVKTEYKVLNPLKFRDMYVLRNLTNYQTCVLRRSNSVWELK